jgi:hypothetical protein
MQNHDNPTESVSSSSAKHRSGMRSDSVSNKEFVSEKKKAKRKGTSAAP